MVTNSKTLPFIPKAMHQGLVATTNSKMALTCLSLCAIALVMANCNYTTNQSE